MEHLPSRARVFSRSGMYNLGCGRYEQAVPLLEKASEIAERLHDYRQWGESSALLAYIDYLVARFEASRARFARVYQMAAQVGNAQFQNWGQWGQAQALLRLGRVDEARSALDAACLRLESGPDRGTEAITYGLLGLVHLRQGNWREAVAYACRLACVEQMERFSLADFEGHASAAEVFLTLLESGQDMRVELAPEERRKATERACQSAAHYGRVYAIGQPRAHLLAGRLKRLDGQLKEALDGWQKGLRLAEALKMPYEQARLHAALASVLPEEAGQSHREAARRLFEQLNALPDLTALEQFAG